MKPVHYIPVGGTRAWNDRDAPKRRWWQKDSDFAHYMKRLNCIMYDPDQPFVWTTDLGGYHFWRRWKIWNGKFDKLRDHRDWISGGENFIRYCETPKCNIVPYEDRNVITHSHGFQVVAYACKLGLRIRRLISIAPPERADMVDVVEAARGNIEFWVLVIDPECDSLADWGAFGDGFIGRRRTFDHGGGRPDYRIAIPGHEHSGLVNHMLDRWSSFGVAEYLR